MLYKVTPMLPPPQAQKAKKGEGEGALPRKRRKTAIYDADGQEVLITLMCLKCRSMKPLAQFGLRKMADGAIRNQPWCRTCRGATGGKKKPQVAQAAPVEAAVALAAPAAAEPPPALAPAQTAPAVVEIALADPQA